MSQCHSLLVQSKLLTNAVPEVIQHLMTVTLHYEQSETVTGVLQAILSAHICTTDVQIKVHLPRASREGDKGMGMTTFGVLRGKTKGIKLLDTKNKSA